MDGNNTYLIEEYGSDIVSAFLPIDVIFSIILVAGIIGNMFVIFIYAIKMRKDKRESRYFIPVLAFYDLLVCILSETYNLSKTFFWATFPSDEICKTLIFFLAQAMFTSNTFLLAIAVQRYIKICRPFAKQMTLFWRRITMAVVIVTNILVSIPTSVVSGVQDLPVVYRNTNITGKGCSTGNEIYPKFQLIYYAIMLVFLFANIAITAGMYTPVACVIYRRFRKRRSQSRTEIGLRSVEESDSREDTLSTMYQNSKASQNTTTGKDPAKSTKTKVNHRGAPKTNFNLMFFVIIFAYVVAYVPTSVILTYDTVDDTIWTRNPYGVITIYTFLKRLYVFNHAANPFIYTYFDSEFRSHITYLFRRWIW